MLASSLLWGGGLALAHVAWQATLVAFLLYVALRFGHRWHAAWRYRAAGVAYVIVAALAGLAMLGVVPASAPADRPLGIVSVPREVHADPQATFEVPDPNALRADVANLQRRGSRVVARESGVAAAGTRMSALATARGLVPALGAAWVAAALFGLARLGWAARRVRAIVRSSDLAPKHLEARFRALSLRCGLGDRVALRTSGTVEVPCAVGGRRPVVLLPLGIDRDLATEQLDAIVLHELIHLQRRDTTAAAIQAVFDAVFWFHPAVRWISAHVRATREVAVDAAVVAAAVDATSYARALFAVCERAPACERVLTASTGGQLADRIGRLVGEVPARARARPRSPLVAALVVAGCGAWIAAAASEGFPATLRPSEPGASWTWLTAKGSVELDVGLSRGIVAIEPGGWVRIDERRVEGVRSWWAAPDDDGAVHVAYLVDGAPAEFDAEAERALVAALERASALPRFGRLGDPAGGWSHAKAGDVAGDLVTIVQFDAHDPDAVEHLVAAAIGRVRDAALRSPDDARSTREPDVAHHTEVTLILIHQLASHEAIEPGALEQALARLEAALAGRGP